jgi:serine/threonine protein phosphatase PrpC
VTLRREALDVRAFGATHTGRVRAGNEDSFLVADLVFAVADGMGGHQAGEIASDAALEPLRALDLSDIDDPAALGEQLADAVRAANTLVVERAAADPELEGMGTTLTAVAVRDGQLHVAHVGDSRAYLLRDDEPMSQLTTDHTLVERLVREGRLSRDEAATHPQRNVITRAIGHESTVDVEVLPPITLRDGDQILLCSDGLSGPVPDARISETLAETVDGDDAVRALLALANAAGGPDNITAVLVRVGNRWSTATTTTAAAAGGSATQQVTTRDGGRAAGSGGTQSAADDAGAGPAPEAHASQVAIDTSAPPSDEPWAEKMGRVGAPQGTDATPDGGGRSRAVTILLSVVAVVVLVAIVAGGAAFLLSRSYYVGEYEGTLAIYRGLPQEIAGVSASQVLDEEITATPVDGFPAFRQQTIREGLTAQSLDDARRIVADLQGQLEANQAPSQGVGEPLTEPTLGP